MNKPILHQLNCTGEEALVDPAARRKGRVEVKEPLQAKHTPERGTI